MTDVRAGDKTPAGAEAGALDAVVVGAGFSGIYMLYLLRQQGLTARVYEAGEGVGGTWYWNRYPGARCDSESMDYAYSFSEALQQEWNWSERFSGHAEIRRYLNHVVDRFELRRSIQFKTTVVAAHYGEEDGRWTLTMDTGEVVRARFCVMATGCLSMPQIPDVPGIKTFRGETYHSSRWPEEGVDFTGKTVGIIGTGSSGIQMIPVIAEEAKHLYVFQRTANFSVPARNHPLDAEYLRDYKAHYREHREAALRSAGGTALTPDPTRAVPDDAPEERRRRLEDIWRLGGSDPILTLYRDILTSKESNDVVVDFVAEKIRDTVADPTVADLLIPKDHPFGTKRLCVDTNYYETFNRPNVTLVDVRKDPIREITPDGLATEGRRFALDAIAFATGFDAMTGALFAIDIKGREGKTLKDKWAAGPRTFLGLMMAGFPNLFTVTGPGSPSVKSNMVMAIEQHVEWIARCIADLRAQGVVGIEPTLKAENDWTDHVADVGNATLFPLANSWYVGANIPGKPRVFMPYVGGLARYRQICDEIAADHYRGFTMTRASMNPQQDSARHADRATV
ncbi:MAG: NAD(P)/FAD-dependent oxidoreductase [Alphaproteobacteria bacterium]